MSGTLSHVIGERGLRATRLPADTGPATDRHFQSDPAAAESTERAHHLPPSQAVRYKSSIRSTLWNAAKDETLCPQSELLNVPVLWPKL
jgi:hypothetical protein